MVNYVFLLGKRVISSRELENITQEDWWALLEEIPDGDVSDIDDCSDDELASNELEQNKENNVPFDITSMPVVFNDDIFEGSENADVFIANQVAEKGDHEWSSDDEVSLESIRKRMFRENTVWTTSNKNCLLNKKAFSSISGPCIPDDTEEPTDIFLHIFPLIDHIVFQTNLYALQNSGGDRNAFLQTNPDEVKIFIAINLLMGIKRLPSVRDYWSSRRDLRDSFISSCMPRDRFIWLLKNLHLNDNSVQPKAGENNFDKLYKVRPVLDKLSETFLASYKPSKNQAIDESMIKFKGRTCLRQYMPLKPIKHGYKVWIRADESGYVCQFQIYTGKVNDLVEKKLRNKSCKGFITRTGWERTSLIF